MKTTILLLLLPCFCFAQWHHSIGTTFYKPIIKKIQNEYITQEGFIDASFGIWASTPYPISKKYESTASLGFDFFNGEKYSEFSSFDGGSTYDLNFSATYWAGSANISRIWQLKKDRIKLSSSFVGRVLLSNKGGLIESFSFDHPGAYTAISKPDLKSYFFSGRCSLTYDFLFPKDDFFYLAINYELFFRLTEHGFRVYPLSLSAGMSL